MNIVKRNNSLFPSFFDDFFGRDFGFGNDLVKAGNVPAVNVKESEQGFNLEVALPGYKKDDLKITLEKDRLTLSSEKENKVEEKDEDGRFTRREFSYQSFSRSFRLPEGMIDESKVNARFEDGVLYLDLPKKSEQEVQNSRMIEIR